MSRPRINNFSILSHTVVVLLLNLFLVVPTVNAQNGFDQSSFENVFWRDRPLNLHLKTGVERLLRFPSPVQIGVPPEMMPLLKMESASNVVYLTALADFDTSRIRFRELSTGTIYLFNVYANPEGNVSLLQLVNAQSSNDEVSTAAESKTKKVIDHGYHTLSRFAFQNVYSPERLIESLEGVRRYTIKSKKPVNHLFPGEDIAAVPWRQWRSSNGLYVTAVYISNLSGRSVRLDPRFIRHSEHWHFTSLMTDYLAPHDGLGDSTTMVVVSSAPWEDSVSWLR